MSASRVVAAWMAMLLLGAALWFAGGSRLVAPPATPTPEVVPSPTPGPSPSPSPTPTPNAASADPGEFAGRWADLEEADTILVVQVAGSNLEVGGVGVFQPDGAGFQQVDGDTLRRLELDDDGNLQLFTTALGNEGQRRTVRVFTPEPEGDVPADPKQTPP